MSSRCGQRGRERHGADARGYTRASPIVAPECPHLLEHGVELDVSPQRATPIPRLASGARSDLALEEPEAERQPLRLVSTRLDERDRVDLDDRDVEAAGRGDLRAPR